MKQTWQKRLLVWVTFAAVGTVGSVYAGPLLASLAFTVSLTVVLASIIAACTIRGATRPYWRGFARCATAYFMVTFSMDDCRTVANALLGVEWHPPEPSILTSYLLAWLYDHVGRVIRTNGGTPVPAMLLVHIGRDQLPSDLDISNFESMMTTGHSVFTILFGILAGRLARRLSRLASCSS